jgi:hypothetical protein
MKKIILIIFLIILNAGCNLSPPGRTSFDKAKGPFPRESKIDASAENNTISNNTDIHYNAKYCNECHTKIPTRGKDNNKFLKFDGDFKQLCKCHYETQARDLHPVDLIPSDETKKNIPEKFPLSDGNLTCDSCHDIFIQCQDIQDPYQRQKDFLRGGPYKNNMAFCFKCHDIKNFNKYNPHKQLNEKGDVIQETCFYCHTEVPDVRKIDREHPYLIGKSTMALCVGCHNPVDKTSLHYRHVLKPSPSVLQKISQMEKDHNMILPLSDSGMITCTTCHDPHQYGLIPGYRSGAIDPGEEKKNQFSGNLCVKCHEMK